MLKKDKVAGRRGANTNF